MLWSGEHRSPPTTGEEQAGLEGPDQVRAAWTGTAATRRAVGWLRVSMELNNEACSAKKKQTPTNQHYYSF